MGTDRETEGGNDKVIMPPEWCFDFGQKIVNSISAFTHFPAMYHAFCVIFLFL